MKSIKRRQVTSRHRTIRTCEVCRRRKIKCDQKRPKCGQCEAASRHCEYLDSQTDTRATTRDDTRDGIGVDQDGLTHQAGAMLLTGSRHRYIGSSTLLLDVLLATDNHGQSLQASPPALITSAANLPKETGGLGSTPEWLLEVSEQELGKLTHWFSENCFLFAAVITSSELEVLLSRCLVQAGNIEQNEALLLAAVCYIAALSITMWSPTANLQKSPGQWKAIVEKTLDNCRGSSSLRQLKALMLLAISSISEQGHSLNNPSVVPTATIVRIAQLSGLHREPSNLLNLDQTEHEERRRLFWIIFDLDVCFALVHGLPTLISQSSYDVHELDTNNQSNPGVRFLKHKSRSNQLFSRILDEIYGIKPPSTSIFNALVTAAEANQNEAEALANFEGPVGRFVQLSLQLIAHKVHFTLHQLYLRTERPRASRKRALDSAIFFVQGYLTCTTDFIFAPLRWVIEHFNVFHPCAIILQDLIQNPHSPEANSLRTVMDSCFTHLNNPTDEKWQILERLKEKAWLVNGWKETQQGDELDLGDLTEFTDWNMLFEPDLFGTVGFQ